LRRSLAVLFFLLIPLAVLAQGNEPGIDVIDVSGPLDRLAVDFMTDSINEAAASGQSLAVLQINSAAVLDADSLEQLIAVIEDPPLPLAVWVGPAPAVAYGGAALITATPAEAAIAPGSEIGMLDPLVLGDENLSGFTFVDTIDPAWLDEPVPAEESGLDLQPTIRQYLQDLNGTTFDTRDGPVVVETVRPFEDGVTLEEVTFVRPGLGTRFFRLAVTPEATFFFLVVGLTIVSFEFFAIGPGVAAGVGALSLLLASWGLVNLPVRPWALGLTVLGWTLLTAAYQKGGIVVLTILGAVMLQVGGMWLVDGQGQIDPRWFLILPSVLGALFFFLLAMPTVQRARFSTRTIGRDGLIGEPGVALVDLTPDGMVEVHGARWRATGHREAGITEGSPVVVTGVDGMFLEVEPSGVDREN
jgi:membrane-bound serine protease (ClpP class)